MSVSYLRENVTLNRLSNVTVVAKAVADRVGQAELNIFPDGADVYNSLGARQPPDEHLHATGTIPVEITSLDAFAQSIQLASVDLIKIDVEGAEERVVAGAQQLLSTSPNVTLLMELWEPSAAQCGCSTKRLITSLRTLGFALFEIAAAGKLTPVTPEQLSKPYAVFRRLETATAVESL